MWNPFKAKLTFAQRLKTAVEAQESITSLRSEGVINGQDYSNLKRTIRYDLMREFKKLGKGEWVENTNFLADGHPDLK